MAVFDYVDIPACATIVPSEVKNQSDTSPLPSSSQAADDSASSSPVQGNFATRTVFGNLPGLLLASSLQIPSNASNENPRSISQLLSTRDPLSVPTTTVNFRRFISKIGPIFWLQDRIEEIVTWKKGWKVTVVWMVIYSFLCYYPRLILLLPNAVVLAIIIAAHPPRTSPGAKWSITEQVLPPPRANAREGSTEWLANIQGIQNLMGAVADAHDATFPYVLHLTFATPYTPHIFTVTLLSTLFALPFLQLIPLRPLFLIGGLAPFALTHPFIRHTLLHLLSSLPLRHWCARLTRLVDNDRLKDRHWQSELREVELFENERWVPGEGTGWSKANLKAGERVAWTRGRDGWSGVTAHGSSDVSSNLTFLLEPGWVFVETEDWRADIEAKWSEAGADDLGWVYTNDAWLEPRALPMAEWKTQGAITRRRRWLRRIYFNRTASAVL
ncbi:integral peroxisomal membrane peroxin-domain-containing protein [Multifurca ochricompacta]|uniref:Integral peroxisomal membrane peroxin-domain-containing protein n=1 Tax=Multifurca ochricompacta TaxID=376703 RepID=A0AAD4M914_9AGAM|nr:integral peroxisomal membrane peroxin-domain-containing protein [Multifurca ochricompacta]